MTHKRMLWWTMFGLGLCLITSRPADVFGATTARHILGTIDTWVLSSSNLPSGSRMLSNPVTVTTAGYLYVDCELNAPSWSGTVTANTGISVWLLKCLDGTLCEDGDAGTDPARLPDVTFPLRNVSSAQRVTRTGFRLPITVFKVLLKNDGTGQTLQGATSAYSLRCTPWTIQNQ